MCEKSLYNKLVQNQAEIAKLNGQYFTVKDKIQLKMKLLDTKVITGDVYIDRSKNLSSHYYEVTEDKQDKVTYKKRSKTPMGKAIGIDFDQLLKDRKPQGVNTGFKSGESPNDN
jgi:hypothetical protein